MMSPLEDLGDWFTYIDATSPSSPACFVFAIPLLTAYQRWPDYPMAARPEAGRAGGGAGLTEAAARTSALGEAIEIASSCEWPDEQLVLAVPAELADAALSPEALVGFSADQIADREAWNAAHLGIDWCPAPCGPKAPLAWVTAHHAVTGAERLVPADHVLVGRRSAGDPGAVAVANTSGCAAGPTVIAARLAAVLELIERDAIGRWWYGARRRPQIDPAGLELPGSFLSDVLKRARRMVLFDITTDLGVPVCAAVSWEPDGTHVAMGFGAKPNPSAAALHAMLEALQIEIGVTQRLARQEPEMLWWCDEVTAATSPLDSLLVASMTGQTGPDNEADTLVDVVERCTSNRIDIWFVDRTRPEFGVPVVRAIASRLCTDKPRWGRDRLLAPDPGSRRPGAPGSTPPNTLPLVV